jgi:hypothetical protein
MDLTAGQRRLAFLAVVVVLAGLGTYLLIPGARSSTRHGAARPSAGISSLGPTVGPATPVPAATTPAATPAPAGSGAPDIYQWLPFTQADLGKAATAAQKFGADYDTFSYTQNAASYVASMHGLITSQLSGTLARGFATPGVAGPRAQQKQVSTATATITALRAFGAASVLFVVSIKQAMNTKQGKIQRTGQFAVTVADNGGNWLVNDIEPASAGNT